jgi:thiol-disulfide isomerase/thioredoxin
MRRHSRNPGSENGAQRVAAIVAVAALALCSDANVLTRPGVMKTAEAEDGLIGALRSPKLAGGPPVANKLRSSLGDEGPIGDLGGAIGWLNSSPLSKQLLHGKVVLFIFWTYTCINSLRPMPYVEAWAAKYKDAGLVVIGVHTPEFSFEHERANVENALRNLKVTFPVAIDSNYSIWQAFDNQYWRMTKRGVGNGASALA